MTPDIALQQLRNLADRLHASGCHWRSERITEAADAIEAAMRESVAIMKDGIDKDGAPVFTKLFTFPPSAQAELVRITEQLAERDAEIERMQARIDGLMFAHIEAALAGNDPPVNQSLTTRETKET